MRRRLRRRRRGLSPDRWTFALAGVAGAVTVAAVAVEVGRVWRHGSAPLPRDTDDIVLAAESAVAETAEVARAGYRDVSRRENALFNLLSSFVTTFLLVRGVTALLRTRKRFGPFRHVVVGRRHIHHFIPGIVLAFAAGAAAILVRDERLDPKLAVPFGAGLGLTLDESALLLELDDVYWTQEGLLSVQITLAVTAMLGSITLLLRLLRRGERVVLESGA